MGEREGEGGREESIMPTSSMATIPSFRTSASELSVFSPPERLEMFFQLFFGGRTLKTIPSENGSRLSTSSSSASPPRVII